MQNDPNAKQTVFHIDHLKPYIRENMMLDWLLTDTHSTYKEAIEGSNVTENSNETAALPQSHVIKTRYGRTIKHKKIFFSP